MEAGAGMTRVDRHRGEHGKHALAKELVERFALFWGKVFADDEADALLRQRRDDRFIPTAVLLGHQLLGTECDSLQLRHRTQPGPPGRPAEAFGRRPARAAPPLAP